MFLQGSKILIFIMSKPPPPPLHLSPTLNEANFLTGVLDALLCVKMSLKNALSYMHITFLIFCEHSSPTAQLPASHKRGLLL